MNGVEHGSVDERWMSHAIALARKSEASDEVPVGAILVREGRIVGEGWNQPIISRDPTAHAEIVALRRAGQTLDNYRMPGCTLYVTLEPCTMCAGALIHARIERLVFGAKEGRSGAVVSTARALENPALNHRILVTAGILEAECSQLMTAFFRGRR